MKLMSNKQEPLSNLEHLGKENFLLPSAFPICDVLRVLALKIPEINVKL